MEFEVVHMAAVSWSRWLHHTTGDLFFLVRIFLNKGLLRASRNCEETARGVSRIRKICFASRQEDFSSVVLIVVA